VNNGVCLGMLSPHYNQNILSYHFEPQRLKKVSEHFYSSTLRQQGTFHVLHINSVGLGPQACLEILPEK